MKKLLIVLSIGALVVPAVSSAALPAPGRFALGYFNANAPIGGRYMVSEKVGLDLGVGFAQAMTGDDPTTATVGDSKKNLQIHVEAGVPYTVLERGNARFFVRPGALFRLIPTYNRASLTAAYEKKTEVEIEATGILGVEWFPTDDFSLSVGHGLRLVSSKNVGANELTTGSLSSETMIDGLQALDLTRIGFHFYF